MIKHLAFYTASVVAVCGALVSANDSPNDFSLKLLQNTLPTQPGNVCISPWSAGSALALVQPGAEGISKKQLDTVLGSADRWQNALKKVNLTIEAANRIYTSDALPLSEKYLASVPKDSVIRVDFAKKSESVRSEINQWVEKMTHDRIRDLLPPGSITPSTELTAVNAVWMKNTWQEPFSEGSTSEAKFYLTDGSSTTVPTMHKTADFPSVVTDDLMAIALPYRHEAGEDDSKETAWFIIIMPKEGTNIREFTASLTQNRLGEIMKKLRDPLSFSSVALALPKFKMTTGSMNLNGALAASGLSAIFGSSANFAGITGGKAPIAVSDVLQKCFIQVDEEGTEAAAATGVVMMRCALGPRPKAFRVNRPFFWRISTLNENEPAFFTGIIENPAQ